METFPETKLCSLDAGAGTSETESKNSSKYYEVRLGYRIWTGCVALVMLCHAVVALFEIPNTNQKFTTQVTLLVANKVREVITSLTVVVMEVYLLSKSSLALLTASQCLDLLPASHGHSSSFSSNVWVTVSGIFFIICNIVVLTSYVAHSTHVERNIKNEAILYSFTQCTETIIYLLVNTFVIIFFYTVIQILCGVLENVRKQLMEAWATKQKWESATQQTPCVLPCHAETIAKGSSTDPSFCTHAGKNSKVKFPEDLADVTKSSRTMLAQLQTLQRSLNRYLGLPVTLIMLTSVIYSILACFYLSYMRRMTGWMRLMSISYLAMAIVPQLLLSNFPVFLQTQVGWPADLGYPSFRTGRNLPILMYHKTLLFAICCS